ncbi:hypothetical protein HDU79_008713, partial [Rhizoclosmatium sp. JEL0117]
HHRSYLEKFGSETQDFPIWLFRFKSKCEAEDCDIAQRIDPPPEPAITVVDLTHPTDAEKTRQVTSIEAHRATHSVIYKATRKAKAYLVSALSNANIKISTPHSNQVSEKLTMFRKLITTGKNNISMNLNRKTVLTATRRNGMYLVNATPVLPRHSDFNCESRIEKHDPSYTPREARRPDPRTDSHSNVQVPTSIAVDQAVDCRYPANTKNVNQRAAPCVPVFSNNGNETQKTTHNAAAATIPERNLPAPFAIHVCKPQNPDNNYHGNDNNNDNVAPSAQVRNTPLAHTTTGATPPPPNYKQVSSISGHKKFHSYLHRKISNDSNDNKDILPDKQKVSAHLCDLMLKKDIAAQIPAIGDPRIHEAKESTRPHPPTATLSRTQATWYIYVEDSTGLNRAGGRTTSSTLNSPLLVSTLSPRPHPHPQPTRTPNSDDHADLKVSDITARETNQGPISHGGQPLNNNTYNNHVSRFASQSTASMQTNPLNVAIERMPSRLATTCQPQAHWKTTIRPCKAATSPSTKLSESQ